MRLAGLSKAVPVTLGGTWMLVEALRTKTGSRLPNAGSIGIHEALGFTHIGTYPEAGFKHGQWHSVGYWRKPLCAVTPPIEITPFCNL